MPMFRRFPVMDSGDSQADCLEYEEERLTSVRMFSISLRSSGAIFPSEPNSTFNRCRAVASTLSNCSFATATPLLYVPMFCEITFQSEILVPFWQRPTRRTEAELLRR